MTGVGATDAVEWKDRGLDAEPQKSQKIDGKQGIPRHGRYGRVQVSPHCKGRSGAVPGREDQCDEGAGRAADRIDQVLSAGGPGAVIHGVHHERQRGQGHELIEKVERQQVRGEGDTEHHAVGQDEPGEEGFFAPLVLHIL